MYAVKSVESVKSTRSVTKTCDDQAWSTGQDLTLIRYGDGAKRRSIERTQANCIVKIVESEMFVCWC